MKLVPEYLRCTDNFHRRPRFDVCLVRQPNGTYIFARLELIFTCQAAGKDWKLARVTLFKTIEDAGKSATGMRRVRQDRAAFVMLSWIVRSVFLSPTFDKGTGATREWFVNDLVDSEDDPSDMYIRLKELTSDNCL
jgi:hypothetical protein